MKKPLTALVLTVAMLAVAPSPAHAGSYVLVGCADLAGALGPRHVVRPADGWFQRGASPSRQQCAAGRNGPGIYASGSQDPNLFRLDAPPGTAVSRLVLTYRWQRCDATGEECAVIGGAIERTYALRPGEVGQRVRAALSASDGGGSVRVASAPSAVVAERGTGPSGGFHAAAPSVPTGRLTGWLERGRRRLRAATVRWPIRVRIRGRLTDRAGRPLAHTAVRMLERVEGRPWRALTGVRTRRDGRLTTFTQLGPSRHLRLVYGRASVNLRLRVRATARLRVRRAGALTLVSGRLLGGRVPPTGVRVRLQARYGARWSTCATLRTDGLGRFSATGRAPAGVRLRIAIPAQRGYPSARGVSRP